MAHNFKIGVDHLNNIDEPNTYFVDGGCFGNVGGDDVTGDGSSSSPWKTLTHAYANTSNFDTIVFVGEFNNQVGSISAGWQNRNFIGDSLNRDVIVRDTVGDKVAFQGSSTTIKNITVLGYNTATISSVSLNSEINNCVFIDCDSNRLDKDTLYQNCIFINTKCIITDRCEIKNTIFYNSNIVNNNPFPSQANFTRCFFDENSNYIASTGQGPVRLANRCHVNDLTTFDSGDNTNLDLTDSTLIDEVNSPALFTSPSFIDLAVDKTSPLITNDIFGNVGNVYRGFSFTPDQQGFIDAVTANPDIEVVNSELVLASSVPVGESRTIQGFSITASGINRLSTAYQVGLDLKCEYVFEVRWADPGVDINTRPWKPFRLGEEMTQNSDGTTTGEAGYNWGDNNPINYKVAEGRLVLTQV